MGVEFAHEVGQQLTKVFGAELVTVEMVVFEKTDHLLRFLQHDRRRGERSQGSDRNGKQRNREE